MGDFILGWNCHLEYIVLVIIIIFIIIMRHHLYLILVERSQREVQSVQRDGRVDDTEADNVLTPVLPPTCRGSGLGLEIRD